MTVTLVIGSAFLAYGLLHKGRSSPCVESSAIARAGNATDRRVQFGTVTLHQAPGTRITALGVARHCLILQLEGGEQGQRVIVVDLDSGRVLGTVTVESAPCVQ